MRQAYGFSKLNYYLAEFWNRNLFDLSIIYCTPVIITVMAKLIKHFWLINAMLSYALSRTLEFIRRNKINSYKAAKIYNFFVVVYMVLLNVEYLAENIEVQEDLRYCLLGSIPPIFQVKNKLRGPKWLCNLNIEAVETSKSKFETPFCQHHLMAM